MEQSILEIVWQNTPFTALCIAIAVLSGWVVYTFMRFNSRLEKNEKGVADLGNKMTGVEMRLDKVDERLNTMNVKMAVMDTKLDVLIEKVNKLTDRVDMLTETPLGKRKAS